MTTFLETKTQFIILEEGFSNTNNFNEYKLIFTNDMFSRHRCDFPQFEFSILTNGGYGFASYMNFNYKGYQFTPKYEGFKERELFVLSLLNQLKNGDYHKILTELIKKSVSEEEFKRIEYNINFPNIKAIALQKEIEILLKEVEILKNK